MSINDRLGKIESAMKSQPPDTALDDLGTADLLRVLAKSHYPSGGDSVNIEALNPDEQGYWASLWLTKPSPDDWSVREVCMFEQLHRALAECKSPWPDNHRFSGLGYVEMMAGVTERRINTEGANDGH